jgi:hypothetical protein
LCIFQWKEANGLEIQKSKLNSALVIADDEIPIGAPSAAVESKVCIDETFEGIFFHYIIYVYFIAIIGLKYIMTAKIIFLFFILPKTEATSDAVVINSASSVAPVAPVESKIDNNNCTVSQKETCEYNYYFYINQ